MKLLRVAFIAAAVTASVAGYSQRDTTRIPTDTTHRPDKKDTMLLKYGYGNTGYSANNEYNNDVISIVADTNQPNFGRYYIPVLGNYTSSTQSEGQSQNVTIQGDQENAGKIWIEGLTSEKIYALRKTAVGTYKIPAQKVNETSVPEGTVLYDDNSKEVRICIGRKFVDSNPSEAFVPTEETTIAKKKQKTTSVISFTGTKTDAGTAKM